MGCFDSSCLFTSQSIHFGDSCAVILMVSQDDSHAHGTTRLFVPVSLPIFGKYDDYGGLEKIVKDKNTEALEAYYGTSPRPNAACTTATSNSARRAVIASVARSGRTAGSCWPRSTR
jgi:hypothetical protein